MESQPKPETTRPTLASLWIQIQNSYVDALDGRSFVPPTGLTTIFTSPAIAAAVAELSCAAEDCLGLADAIRCGGIPTFAILVWMQQPDLVITFRRKRCLDRLPLGEETARGAAGKYAPTFLRLQWEFLPFYFRNGQDVEIGREILPFIRNLGPLTPGGFGDVEKLEIHPSLQNFAPHDVSPAPLSIISRCLMSSLAPRASKSSSSARCCEKTQMSPPKPVWPASSVRSAASASSTTRHIPTLCPS